jgi:hypothetical protein
LLLERDAGLGAGFVAALVAMIIGGLTGYSQEIVLIETVHWSWSKFLSELLLPSRRGFRGGRFVMLFAGLLVGQLVGLEAGPSAGVGAGLGVWLSAGLGAGVCLGLVVGLEAGLSAELKAGLGLARPLVLWLGVGLLVGLAYKLSIGLAAGLSGDEITTKNVPNEGIHRSVRMAVSSGLASTLLVGLLVWLGVGLGAWLRSGLSAELLVGLATGLFAGTLVGLAIGFSYGGRACLQHLVLRLSLQYYDCIPRRYVDFLNYVAERLFLRRVGGGYIFIHRLLQEYFATMYLPERGDSPPQPSLPPL